MRRVSRQISAARNTGAARSAEIPVHDAEEDDVDRDEICFESFGVIKNHRMLQRWVGF
jgi:hypothetical protein